MMELNRLFVVLMIITVQVSANLEQIIKQYERENWHLRQPGVDPECHMTFVSDQWASSSFQALKSTLFRNSKLFAVRECLSGPSI